MTDWFDILEAARQNPAGLSFKRFEGLLVSLGFVLKRQRGSHRMYGHPDVVELVNVQSDGGKAKAYQVRQVLRLVDVYGLKVQK